MKILITGSLGFVGSHLAKRYHAQGHNVVGIDNGVGGYDDNLTEVQTLRIDCCDQGSVDQLFAREQFDLVIHAACTAYEGLSVVSPVLVTRNTFDATVNVLSASIKHKIKRFVYMSSMARYGKQEPPFTEDKQPRPEDPYGIAKYAVECDLKLANQQFGLRYNIIRPHNVLGIYQNIWDRYRNVIGIFIRRTLNGEPLLIYGDGEQTRAFSDIKYYMEPFDKLLNGFDGETFNIGADKYFTLNEVAKTVQSIGKKYGYDVDIEHGEPRHEVKHAYCDHTKAKNVLGFKDNTNLDELIEEMFVWSMKQPNRKIKDMDYEITKDMYDYWKK